MARFYNPGFKFDDKLRYENKVADRESNNISFYDIHAPEKGFFVVADTQTLKTPEGEEYVFPLTFKKLVRVTYRDRGVILIDPMCKDVLEEDNVAASDADAKKKGEKMWKEFMWNKVREWQRIVDEVRAHAGIPIPATGLYKRILEEVGMADPADTVGVIAAAKADAAKTKEEAGTVAELRRMIEEQGRQIATLTKGARA